MKGHEWERSVGQCGQNTAKEGELGLAQWGLDRGWSHSSLTPTPVPFPCHPTSPASLILVTDELDVWAQPGLGAGETEPCKQTVTPPAGPNVLERRGAACVLWEGTQGKGAMTGSAWEGQGGLCRGNLEAES